VNKTVTGK